MAAMKPYYIVRPTEMGIFRYRMGSRRSQSKTSIFCKRLFLFRADFNGEIKLRSKQEQYLIFDEHQLHTRP